jgi:hypothetical protein
MGTSQHSPDAVRPWFQSEVTVAPAYHPEFGYLCPSPAVRRRLRAAMIFAGIGMLIGASIVLSLTDRRPAEGQRSERTLTAGQTDRDWSAVAKAADSENNFLPVASQGSTSAPSVQGACKDEGASFLNLKCRSGTKRKAHAARPPATRLATIEIGRIPVATETQRSASAGTNGKSTQAGAGASKPPDESPHSSNGAIEKAAVPAKKSTRHARIRERSREPSGDGSNAFAYAFPYAQYYRRDDAYRGEREAYKHNWGWPR